MKKLTDELVWDENSTQQKIYQLHTKYAYQKRENDKIRIKILTLMK